MSRWRFRADSDWLREAGEHYLRILLLAQATDLGGVCRSVAAGFDLARLHLLRARTGAGLGTGVTEKMGFGLTVLGCVAAAQSVANEVEEAAIGGAAPAAGRLVL